MRNYSRFKDAVVVVTGCDYGFGRDIALTMHKHGATVFAGCLGSAACEKLLAEISTADRSRMRPVVLDVTKQADVDRVKEEVTKLGLPLLAVINNAGTKRPCCLA